MTEANRRPRGFTLIELLVVMAIVGLLASIAAPRYFHSIDTSRDHTLKTSLRVMRDALDQYASDKGRYPDSLEELVRQHYLREIPEDPLTRKRDTWVLVTPPPESALPGKLGDVRSGMAGRAPDGRLYADW